MRDYIEKITRCRLCQNRILTEVFSLGVMANASVFPASPTEHVRTGSLTLKKCECCGLVQLSHVYGRDDIDAGHYGYRSGLNLSMVSHLRTVADLIRTFRPNPDSIMDIGANDGTLLNMFSKKVYRVGVEPNYQQFSEHWEKDIEAHPDYFDANVDYGKFEIITTLAMLYDLEDPIEFARHIHGSLINTGIWVAEQSYLPTMLDMVSYDTICHEHVEYYGIEQLEYIAKEVGFEIVYTQMTDTNGGSVLVVLQKGNKRLDCSIIQEERKRTSIKAFDRFAKRVKESRAQLRRQLAPYAVVHGLGASTKGNVILQYCKPEIECIAEINYEKLGRFTPGTGIPIVSEEESRKKQPDAYLVLPWHFRRAFQRRYPDDNLIFPLG